MDRWGTQWSGAGGLQVGCRGDDRGLGDERGRRHGNCWRARKRRLRKQRGHMEKAAVRAHWVRRCCMEGPTFAAGVITLCAPAGFCDPALGVLGIGWQGTGCATDAMGCRVGRGRRLRDRGQSS